MTSIQSPPKLSLTEFLKLPETKPASEYIDGQIYTLPVSSSLENILPLSAQDVFSWLKLN